MLYSSLSKFCPDYAYCCHSQGFALLNLLSLNMTTPEPGTSLPDAVQPVPQLVDCSGTLKDAKTSHYL
jgi:hypothetical protein